MTDGIEAAADVATGAIVAAAVDGAHASSSRTGAEKPHGACLNCGTPLGGAFCSACGQAAHIHRSLGSFWHDFSHSVLHFEGRFWRTLPELVLYPGRLTRRYVDGERAKFVSPMALYLFTVFLMYAVFSFTGGAQIGNEVGDAFLTDNRVALERMNSQIAALEARLRDPQLTATERAEAQNTIAGLRISQGVLEDIASDLNKRDDAADAGQARGDAPAAAATDKPQESDGVLARGFRELTENRSLTAYKLKTNGYKYSWALVPLSIPFMWLLFFWRRDIFIYDHAIFVTYSISFMMLLVIAASLLRTVGVSAWIVTIVLQVIPPIHMYRQLRGAYGLSRLGSLVRLVFLLFAAATVLAIFVSLLFVLGALG